MFSCMFCVTQNLESQLAQEKIDVEHLNELLKQARVKADGDKEALKKATRCVSPPPLPLGWVNVPATCCGIRFAFNFHLQPHTQY